MLQVLPSVGSWKWEGGQPGVAMEGEVRSMADFVKAREGLGLAKLPKIRWPKAVFNI